MEISQHALDCIRRGDPLSVSIEASGVSGNITLTEQDILPGSLQISRMSVSGNQIELGIIRINDEAVERRREI